MQSWEVIRVITFDVAWIMRIRWILDEITVLSSRLTKIEIADNAEVLATNEVRRDFGLPPKELPIQPPPSVFNWVQTSRFNPHT